MSGFDSVGFGEVGDGPGDLDELEIAASRETEAPCGVLEDLVGFWCSWAMERRLVGAKRSVLLALAG